MFLQNSCNETLTPNVMVLESKVFGRQLGLSGASGKESIC